MKHLTGILAIVVMITIGLACSGDDTQKANDLVKEANKFVIDANDGVKKAEAKGTEYDSKLAKITTDKQVEELREFGKEIMKIYDSMNENFGKAGGKFEEASKLKVNDKFKEYLELKGREMKKRAEYSLEIKKIPQALIDSKKREEYVENAKTYGTNAKKILDEAKDLGDKADKIIKENPTVIKPLE
ncbi:MAG: hypothetical protein AAB336_10810 [Acidobacteriota bacterium]